jgi:ubiquinone/menaquinone biosynthesis C-methylase UbiE
MVVQQPVVARIPGLTTNQQIRTRVVLEEVSGRLLDIGCGSNRLVRTYRQAGGEGKGVDVYPWKGADLIVPDTSQLPFPSGSFDTVSFVASFNHIPNREDVLCEAYRLLSPGGRVVLTNLAPFVSRIWHHWAFSLPDTFQDGWLMICSS